MPPFQEKEVDKYFAHFEKVADNLNWPKESWGLLLQSGLGRYSPSNLWLPISIAELVSVGYLVKDNILMRTWSPTECDKGKKGKTVYQIVVPIVHRRGRLGTLLANRVLEYFLAWCQMGRGKVVQRVPHLPLRW